MNYSLFSENMKLADLVLANYQLLYVFPRFDIELGMGENTVKQICEKKKVSVPLFLLVCNIYTFDDYKPDNRTLEQIHLDELIGYLRSSHNDYSSSRMPQIISKILELANSSTGKYGEILSQFCEKYKEEVIAHFNYEEQVVYPYIVHLAEGSKNPNYNIEQYEDNHSNIDAALNDLKNIIIKYLPNEYTIDKCRSVLIDLFLFESDLSKHTLLEDKILVSLVERIEKGI